MAKRTLVVFDFDHTITPWDTAARFFVWLIRNSAWKTVVVLLAFPLLGPLLIVRRTRRVPLRFGAWVATLGVSSERLSILAREHIKFVCAKGEAFLRKDAITKIQFHLELGHEVVVATGSLEVLACEILSAEGMIDVVVVGSSVRSFLGGMVVNEHCFGERKIPMLHARGFDAPFACVYSDHAADVPLLRCGAERYIVNPSRRSAAILRAELGDSAVVLSWK